MSGNILSNPINLKRIRITDAFWKKEIELVRDTVVPYQWEALNDRVADAQPSYLRRDSMALPFRTVISQNG